MDSIVAFLRVRSEDLQTSFYFIWSLLLSLEKKKKRASCRQVSGAQRFEAHTDLCL